MRIQALFRVPRVILWLTLPTLIVLPDVMNAQVGVTTDIITGVVVDATGNPLANVIVEALSRENRRTGQVHYPFPGWWRSVPDDRAPHRFVADPGNSGAIRRRRQDHLGRADGTAGVLDG